MTLSGLTYQPEHLKGGKDKVKARAPEGPLDF